MKPAQLNSIVIGALAAAAVSTGVMALAELGRNRPDQTPLAFTSEVGEDAIASALVESAKSQADLERASAHARRALSLAPYNNNARLRLAYIDSKLNGGQISKAGAAYVAQSYELAPYDPSVAAWRVRFALENWKALSIDARRATQAEAFAFGSGTELSGKIRVSLQSVQNPVGRVPAQLWLLVLRLRKF